MKIKNVTFLMAMALITASNLFASEYILKLKTGSNKNFLNDKSLDSVQEFRELNLSFGNYIVLKTDNKSQVEVLKNNEDVEFVEPNHVWSINPIDVGDFIDNKDLDTKFDQQWALKNTGKNSSTGSIWSPKPGILGIDINATEAWQINKGSKSIKIAVIDTGVDYNHPDLKDQMWVNEAELNGTKGVDDDGNGFVDDIHGYDFANKDGDPMDGQGHGTHCAGVIGAAHNGSGTMGVMNEVQIVAIKFLTDRGSGKSEDALLSIDYAIKAGVQVMSNSWGGGPKSEALYDAIKAAQEKGIIFIAAAGNDGKDNDSKLSYPASYDLDNIISVGAHDGKGQKARFSNYGKKNVDVFAPGVSIISTVPGSRYKKLSGTSMAAPYVSGMMGLLLSHENNLMTQDLKARLIETSVIQSDLSNHSVSGGRVDALRMLNDAR
jgi:thermitase